MRPVPAVIAGVSLAACGLAQADPYPMPAAPGGAAAIPAAVGEPVHTTVLFLTPRSDDQIELISAEPIGLSSGVSAKFYFSPPVTDGADRIIGQRLEPLAGATFANAGETGDPDATVGVEAELTASKPGRYELASVRLTYRINGGRQLTGEGISVVFVACVDDPKPRPGDCDPPV